MAQDTNNEDNDDDDDVNMSRGGQTHTSVVLSFISFSVLLTRERDDWGFWQTALNKPASFFSD